MADGMFLNPLAARQAAMQAGMISPQQLSQQGLLQQITGTMANAGTMIGGGVGGLFGAEYAPERQARITQEVMQQAGRFASPLTQAQEAYKLFQQQGMTGQAQEMMKRIQELQQQEQKAMLTGVQLQREQASLAEQQAKQQRQKDFMKEVSELPANASNEQLRGIAIKFGDPTTIIADITRQEAAQYRKETAAEAAQLRKEQTIEAARIRAEAAKEAARIRAESRNDALTMQQAYKMANMPKDVAEALAGNVSLSSKINRFDNLLVMLEGKKDATGKVIEEPSVNFNPVSRLKSWSMSKVGNPDQNALNIATIRKAVNSMVNEILMAAKGVQTEGDAQRAKQILVDVNEMDSNEGMANAIRELMQIQRDVLAKNNAYVAARGYGDVVPKGVSAVDVSKMSGEQLVDYYLKKD